MNDGGYQGVIFGEWAKCDATNDDAPVRGLVATVNVIRPPKEVCGTKGSVALGTHRPSAVARVAGSVCSVVDVARDVRFERAGRCARSHGGTTWR